MKNLFEKIFYVNLDKREDRREQIESELERVGVSNYERWPAVDGEELEGNDEKLWKSVDWQSLDDNGDYISRYEKGCYLSHLSLLRYAKKEGYESFLVLEDDAKFEPELRQNWRITISKQLTEGWDMLYLGANDQHVGDPVSQNLYKTDRAFCTHAFAVSQSVYGELISHLESEQFHKPVDFALADLHPQMNVYVFKPHLVVQREGYSDIDREVVNYDRQIRDL